MDFKASVRNIEGELCNYIRNSKKLASFPETMNEVSIHFILISVDASLCLLLAFLVHLVGGGEVGFELILLHLDTKYKVIISDESSFHELSFASCSHLKLYASMSFTVLVLPNQLLH